MTVELRQYQVAAIEAVRQKFSAGEQRTLIVLGTGLGKTVIFSEIARRTVQRGRRVLVLAHRAELLTQAVAKLQAIGVNAAIEQGSKRAGAASVVVASVQTLRAKRLVDWPVDSFGLVIVDECHHVMAASYRAILDHFRDARVLGVTATPDRLDGAGLGEVFESCAFRYEMRDGIQHGWLAPLVARRIAVAAIDLSDVKTRAGDFANDELSETMCEARAVHGIVSPLLDEIHDRLTLAFAVDVAHAHALSDALNTYRPGIAHAIDGTMEEDDRVRILADFAARQFQILVNVAILTEGFDLPAVSCVAIARPTKSRALYTQMCGRAVRTAPGKVDALLLDFVGNVGRHRLIGPVDVLCGDEDLADEARLAAERRLTAGRMDVREAIGKAKESVANVERAAVVAYEATEIDPFTCGVIDTPSVQQLDMMATIGTSRAPATDSPPATESDLARLVEIGLRHIPPGVTVEQAARWLDALKERGRQGLCTYKQAKLLKNFGYDARKMTRERAGEIIGRELARRGVDRSGAA